MIKKVVLIFVALFCLNLFSQIQISAQETPNVKWIRVHSDNAEFSVEVPDNYSYFYDPKGFSLSNNSKDYNLTQMSMLNAYLEKTLLSFESYEVGKGGADAVYNTAKWFSKYNDTSETSNVERSGSRIKQIITKGNNYYCVSQYFNSKSHVYILTAASKNGDNLIIKHFLDSLIFSPETSQKPESKSVSFSSLKIISIGLTEAKDEEKPKETNKIKTDAKEEDSSNTLIIIKKEPPSYTESARNRVVAGKIRLKITFDKNGFIPEIAVIKSLPEGLIRQAVFAALRIKFLPQEKEGEPISTTKTVEYSFDIR